MHEDEVNILRRSTKLQRARNGCGLYLKPAQKTPADSMSSLRMFSCRIDAEAEPRTLPYRALHPNASAVGIHDVPRDRKAQSGSSRLARSRGVYSIKSLKDALQVRLRNSDAGVGDREDDFVTVAIGCHVDLSPRRSVLQGIVHEILQNLAQLHGVAAYAGNIVRQVHCNLEASGLRFQARGLHTTVYQSRHADRM